MRLWLLNSLIIASCIAHAQTNFEYKGQLAAIANYSPQNVMPVLAGVRYIPQIDYKIALDSVRKFDFEASAFVSATAFTAFTHPFDSLHTEGQWQPYRFWARYSTKQFELRVGLQKIDFGSASLLRPLQWFNQIDPRDPLRLTNGVYGVMGRYYFLNNANLWLWVLYGNEKARGFEVVESNKHRPEMGGRLQYPIPKGEIAVSYHYRTANTSHLGYVPPYDNIAENRVGIDAKWNLSMGLWFEATYIHKNKFIDFLTHQTMLNVGADYTFGIGNGLNIVAEHLFTSFDVTPFAFTKTLNLTALTASYPITMFDRLSAISYYNWSAPNIAFFLNYEHQFTKITTYLMPYYSPVSQVGFMQNTLVNQFSGYGIRCMVVYNH